MSRRLEQLFDAIDDGNTKRVIDAVQAGGLGLLRMGDDIGDCALHRAAAGGHTEIVQFLISKGADVRSRNANDDTPLHYGCMFVPVE